MKSHTEFHELENLPKLVQDERRKVAGYLRCDREARALREQMDALLAQSGAEVVLVETTLGAFEVRRAVTRDGRRYASVTRVNDGNDAQAAGA
jgi:methionine synthase I (cobalamin-dependent)